MTYFWIILGATAGVLVLARIYWTTLLSMYPEQVNTSEIHTLVTPDLWKLRLCRYRRGRTTGEPVLLVHGINANQHNFTIPADASLVDFLVSRHYDCWTIDLRGSRSSEPPFEHKRHEVTIDDYLLLDLPSAIHYILDATPYEKVHWVGHSMGGMLLYAYVQEHGDTHIASGTTLGSPVGFKGADMQWLEDAVFFVSRLPRLCGTLFRGYIPMRGRLRIDIPLFPTNMRNLAPGLAAAEVFNLIDDPIPNVLRQMAAWASKEEWKMKGGTLDVVAGLKDMKFPLLAFYGPLDPFTPIEQAQAFFDSLGHDDKQLIICSKENGCQQDYSHCELVFGKDARREVYEPIARWMAAHALVAAQPEFLEEDFVAPLVRTERADILSGLSYSHLRRPDTPENDGADNAPAEKKPAARKRAAAKPKARKKKPAEKRKAEAKKKTE